MATMVLDDPAGYGRVVRDDDGGDVVKVVETKNPGDATPEELAIREVNTGIYAFAGGPLKRGARAHHARQRPGRVLPPRRRCRSCATRAHRVAAHVVDDPRSRSASTTAPTSPRSARSRSAGSSTRHQRAGVTFVNPRATTVDVGVDHRRGHDDRARVRPARRDDVGADCSIGPNATLLAAALGDDVTALHAYVDRLRRRGRRHASARSPTCAPAPASARGAKIGTFVEIKNSDIGEGTKVPHLSYLGDADVGPGTNIGASNVTANYDGRNKHRTTIGANVRTSVDTTFVAPVTVGDNAYTAAGSVITEDVPDEALGVARARQTNVEGYARRKG